jgi:hypothetical protein
VPEISNEVAAGHTLQCLGERLLAEAASDRAAFQRLAGLVIAGRHRSIAGPAR